jgi:crotonobetainyl-CoA:carnitine CoA-transferase CaiB-like acyl-CoA transferase
MSDQIVSCALEGIKVIDVSQVAAVPMAARYLGDFGADVIHVEHPVNGDSFRVIQTGMSMTAGVQSEINYVWENYNRNKKSMTLDLSRELGQTILYKLIEKADVFLTNMRPFELEKYRLEYGILSQLNPGLIYGALTGYGKKGPERDAPAYDHAAYWARSGIPHRLTSRMPPVPPGTPPPAFVPAFGDHMAGMTLACGVMTALFMRERTGTGQEVGVSLFQSGVYQLSYDLAGALVTRQDCTRMTSREDARSPLVTQYLTKDGRWIVLTELRPERSWSRFCQAIEREDLEHDPRFASLEAMTENGTVLMHILEEVFGSRTLEEWRPSLNAARFPWSPVQTFPEVINDRQARDNDFFVSYDHPAYGRVEGVANPVKLSKSPETVRMPAPEFGQHTEEVLLELGYTWEDIAHFQQDGIIA